MNWKECLDFVVEKTRHVRYVELCSESDPNHEVWRLRMCEKAAAFGADVGEVAAVPMGAVSTGTGSVVAYPSLAKQATNFLGAMGRAAVAAVTGEQVIVSDEVFAARFEECKKCEKFDPKQERCSACGCAYRKKLALATESCPLDPPRWTRISQP